MNLAKVSLKLIDPLWDHCNHHYAENQKQIDFQLPGPFSKVVLSVVVAVKVMALHN